MENGRWMVGSCSVAKLLISLTSSNEGLIRFTRKSHGARVLLDGFMKSIKKKRTRKRTHFRAILFPASIEFPVPARSQFEIQTQKGGNQNERWKTGRPSLVMALMEIPTRREKGGRATVETMPVGKWEWRTELIGDLATNPFFLFFSVYSVCFDLFLLSLRWVV